MAEYACSVVKNLSAEEDDRVRMEYAEACRASVGVVRDWRLEDAMVAARALMAT